MSVMIFYRENADYTRRVTEFLHDFERRTTQTIEEIDPDSRRGADLIKIYGIVEYPSIIATTGDGQLRSLWKGLPLPTIDEVSYYVQ